MDVDKTLQFILEQQAQLVGQVNQLSTVILDLATAQQRTNAIVQTLAERHVELAESHKALAESHMDLAQSHKDLAQSHKDLAQSHKELADQQKTTEQNLNALISTLERHLAGHN